MAQDIEGELHETVKNYRFLQTDVWFDLHCEFRKNPDGTVNVTDLSIEQTTGLKPENAG